MSARTLFWLSLLVWAGLYAWSFLSFVVIEPTGDGFTRGLNRVGGFLLWQVAAGITAIVVWRAGLALQSGAKLRWLARLPALLFALLIIAIAALFVYGNFFV